MASLTISTAGSVYAVWSDRRPAGEWPFGRETISEFASSAPSYGETRDQMNAVLTNRPRDSIFIGRIGPGTGHIPITGLYDFIPSSFID